MSGIVVVLTDAKPCLVGQAGLEQCQEDAVNTALSQAGGAESGARGAQIGEFDADLAFVAQHWPALDDDTKRAILAIVSAYLSQSDD